MDVIKIIVYKNLLLFLMFLFAATLMISNWYSVDTVAPSLSMSGALVIEKYQMYSYLNKIYERWKIAVNSMCPFKKKFPFFIPTY